MLIRPFTMRITAARILLFLVFYLGFYCLFYKAFLTERGRKELLSDLGVGELTFNKVVFAVLCVSVALMLAGIAGIMRTVIKNAAQNSRGGKKAEKNAIGALLTAAVFTAVVGLLIVISAFCFNNIVRADRELTGAAGLFLIASAVRMLLSV